MAVSMSNKILVVDDEEAIVSVVKARLVANNYSVVTALGGIDAMQQVIQYYPRIIILDVMMPDLDGYSFVRRLKEPDFLGYDPVIILLTGKETIGEIFDIQGKKHLERIQDRRLKELFAYAGVKDYLLKPFVASELLAKVRHYAGEAHEDVIVAEKEVKPINDEGFESAQTYLLAVTMVDAVFNIFEALEERYRLSVGDNLINSAIAVANSMAKGYKRGGEYIGTRFYQEAKDSLRETLSFVYLLQRRGIVDKAKYFDIRMQGARLEQLIQEEESKLIG